MPLAQAPRAGIGVQAEGHELLDVLGAGAAIDRPACSPQGLAGELAPHHPLQLLGAVELRRARYKERVEGRLALAQVREGAAFVAQHARSVNSVDRLRRA